MQSRTIVGRGFVFTAFLLVFTLAASYGGDDSNDTASVAPGGALRVSLRAEPTSLDPQRASVVLNLALVGQLHRGLFWYDTKLNLTPMAAKEVPTHKNGGISKDGLVYTIKLKEGLKWSDGEALTTRDFEYAAKRLLDPATKAPRASVYYDIKGAERYNTCKDCSDAELAKLKDGVGVKAIDEKTIVFTLNNPRATFLNLLALAHIFPVRQDLIEEYGDAWTEPGKFVGNGPFTLEQWVPKEKLVLKPNPLWWGTKSTLESVTFRIIPDLLTAFNAYLAGELDFVDIPPEQTPTVDHDPILKKQNRRLNLSQTSGYFFNTRIPPFDNDKVREAFVLAVDREGLVTDVLQGVGRPTYSWLPPDAPAYNKRLGQEWKMDVEKARKRLAEAGFPGGNGLPTVSYSYPTSGLGKAYAEYLQQQLDRNLGVRIELVPMDTGAWSSALGRREHSVAFISLAFRPGEAEASMVEVFGCQQRAGDNCEVYPGNNIGFYSYPDIDILVAQALKEQDPERRTKLYEKAERIAVEKAPAIFMINPVRNLLVKPNVQGLESTVVDGLFPGQYFLERAHIEAR